MVNFQFVLSRVEAIKLISDSSENFSQYTDYNLAEILSIGYGIPCYVGNMEG